MVNAIGLSKLVKKTDYDTKLKKKFLIMINILLLLNLIN